MHKPNETCGIDEKWDKIRNYERNAFIIGGILFGIVGLFAGFLIRGFVGI
ncbi:hypothetical protein KAW43_01035 [Candidatus Parcubacteria bacterium]|nr:hypothetical protein [Candidatus Parcubacteria bacterium]